MINNLTSKPFISVVIPVYKAEKYLHLCIESILAQTFQDFELLLVDDGSPDKSGEICDFYAVKDSRIRVYHKVNGGATSARKFGVQHSLGDWIMFIDSDDIIDANGLQIYVDVTLNGCYDIVAGSLMKNYVPLHYPVEGILDSCQYIKALLLFKTNLGPCAKLFRKSLFDTIKWDISEEITNNEDLFMLIILASNCSTIYLSNQLLMYNYMNRDGSASSHIMSIDKWSELFSLIDHTLNKRFGHNAELESAFLTYKARTLIQYFIKRGIFITDSTIIGIQRKYSFHNVFLSPNKYIWVLNHPSVQFFIYRWHLLKCMIKRIVKKF